MLHWFVVKNERHTLVTNHLYFKGITYLLYLIMYTVILHYFIYYHTILYHKKYYDLNDILYESFFTSYVYYSTEDLYLWFVLNLLLQYYEYRFL